MTKQLLQGGAMSDALLTAKVNDPEELVSHGLANIAEAARFLSLGRSKLYDLMDAGRLTYCKIGKARRIPWKAIRALASDSLMQAP
jgi:excisionase family DNA binding protein